mmetsp:Transcript_25694/g.50287  ORF Transcript_25694/g.50287 Transcript_25694/m.50287 type:complete len:259 (-) Transcript_25694:83-859(-)
MRVRVLGGKSRSISSVEEAVLEVEGLADGKAVDELLDKKARSGKHRQAAVVQFLCLKVLELFLVLRGEPERVESQVSGLVLRLEGEEVVGEGRRPALGDGFALGKKDEGGQDQPEVARDLLEVADGRTLDVATEEGVEVLSHQDSEGSKHADAPVLQLGLSPPFDVLRSLSSAEAEGVKEAREGSDPCHVFDAGVELGGGCGSSGGGVGDSAVELEGLGASETSKSDEGGELHHPGVVKEIGDGCRLKQARHRNCVKK